MGGIITLVLYILLGAVAAVLAFLILRAVVRAISHFLIILPEYLWHNLFVLLFVGVFVLGLFMLIRVA